MVPLVGELGAPSLFGLGVGVFVGVAVSEGVTVLLALPWLLLQDGPYWPIKTVQVERKPVYFA